MQIFAHENHKTFHLQNDEISYVICILQTGTPAQLYFGKKIHDKEDFGHLLEGAIRSHSAYPEDGDPFLSLEHVKQEYPSYGSGDFRQGAVELLQENGSRISNFVYTGYEIINGKPKLKDLPATYTESEDDAQTLILKLTDDAAGAQLELFYTIFRDRGVLARSARITNCKEQVLRLERMMSLCLDLPDCNYDWIQFSGSWARERYPVVRKLDIGTTAVESLRGHSSHQQNPFVILKRPKTTEDSGEAMGFSFVYSGNFSISAQVDPYRVTRVLVGINPEWFSWVLRQGESFQTPEALLVFSENGLNGMSRTLHRLFRERLARGEWRDKVRPILLNNWEATYFDFNEEKLLHIAKKAKECGVELFVLDYSRPEVVDYIYGMLYKIISESNISYIKWDMNRSLTECGSAAAPAERQGEIFHRHILGVYSLYERLITDFPHILFESCAGGGARFDAGMLYYAPQAWTSDDTDAVERRKIQYGTSYGYPLISMGSHVSAVPNHQLGRVTSLKTRADVAFFGTYGYELDLNRLSEEEQQEVCRYTDFMKEHRKLIQFGDFYRLVSPFENNESAWMVVSADAKEAIVGYYRTLNTVNDHYSRLYLRGLDPDACYEVKGMGTFYGDELMNVGLVTSETATGKQGGGVLPSDDFSSQLFLLKVVE